MGLDLHDPSVRHFESSSTSLNDLILQKDALESEINELLSVLTSQNVDMKTPLIDQEGFPRDDIDVAQVRTVRARLVCLRNDHKNLMAKIEAGLHEKFSKTPSPGTQVNPSTQAAGVRSDNLVVESAFAVIDDVIDGSPAFTAGLQKNDLIIKFGSVHAGNHENLSKIANLVSSSLGRKIIVTVDRMEKRIRLELMPNIEWGGRGSLGFVNHVNDIHMTGVTFFLYSTYDSIYGCWRCLENIFCVCRSFSKRPSYVLLLNKLNSVVEFRWGAVVENRSSNDVSQ
ncbi:26S proteasome non-ATPase regulatory subunit 9 [Neolecta irregularis DAH-3]|uniref:Probable 26S proteasome regulatory subunit p27 n=1 Tax=Neolecta irregularis (strain DAH-3) TaxID=1198029 RepID=A0A1U7LQE2_NEOID|nr:26S proteasome non-ATPase regulatory subunit 9 [Neolecta irregularis DAH-3]|eukprot:OLL24864.1 26S proteasome non-ATPase regulatory subunit 9 [Neolecta irregularis DAH-3]